MPFLFATPTRAWTALLIVAENGVGVSTKSPSAVCCDGGTCHELTNARLDAFNLTTASARVSVVAQLPGLPVAKYKVSVLASTVIEPDRPAPVQPLGTILNVFTSVPAAASNSKTCDCVSGQSPHDAVPINT